MKLKMLQSNVHCFFLFDWSLAYECMQKKLNKRINVNNLLSDTKKTFLFNEYYLIVAFPDLFFNYHKT